MKTLLALEAVVRCGGTAAAARDLGVTHGAVSKQITLLEEWLGRSLFDRDRQRLRPYDETGAFAAIVADSLDRVAAGLTQLTSGRQVLHVLIHATFAMRWVIPHLPDFYRLAPEIDVHVETRQTGEGLRDSTFDVAVIRGGERIRDWPGRPIMTESITLMAAPDLAASVAAGPAALAGQVLLCSDSRPGELEQWLAAAGLGNRASGWRRQCFGHFHTALQAATNGQGFIAGPLPVLANEVADGLLAIPFPAITIPGPRHVAYFDPAAPNAAAAGRFVDWLQAEGESGR